MSDNNIVSPERYTFWLDDLTVLYKDKGYIKFIPTSEMTRVEQLNALTRFFIYLLMTLLLFDRDYEWLQIPIIGIIMIIILYNLFDNDDAGKQQELSRMVRNRENMTVMYDDSNDSDSINSDSSTHNSNIKRDTSISIESINGTDYVLDAGYYKSNGELSFDNSDYCRSKNGDCNQSNGNYRNKNAKYTLDEMRLYDKNTCRKPTVDNPFMNSTQDDFNKENTAVACNADDEDIHKEIDLQFNADMYRDIEDVFNKKNSQRQFFTIAHNIPNDQEAFARWCYGFSPTCKTDQDRCLRYQDLRPKYSSSYV